jgi:hypothetical protein
MKVILAVYYFLVGDMVILIGIIIALLILTLVNTVTFLTPLRGFSGYFLIIAILIVLGITLNREVRGH